MKTRYLVLMIVLALVCLACAGKDGVEGPVGPTGPAGPTGSSAVTTANNYFFFPVGNPYTRPLSNISLAKIQAGTQTVEVFMQIIAGEWTAMPFSMEILANEMDFLVSVGNGYVYFETNDAGVLYVGDATLGFEVMVVVTDFN